MKNLENLQKNIHFYETTPSMLITYTYKRTYSQDFFGGAWVDKVPLKKF